MPATHVLSATSANFDTAAAEVPSEAKSQLSRRQPPPPTHIWKGLLARYFFHCPQLGSDHLDFIWKATYTFADGGIELASLRNIHSFDTIAIAGTGFSTTFHFNTCINLGTKHCAYEFSGFIDGEVQANSIIMELVTTSLHENTRPKVWEYCIVFHSQPRNPTCAVFEEIPTRECTIERIDIAAAGSG